MQGGQCNIGQTSAPLDGERLQAPAILANGDEIWIGRSVARLSFLIEGEPTQTEHSVT